MNENDKRFEEQARRVLDRDEEALDPVLASRLVAARNRALSQGKKPGRRFRPRPGRNLGWASALGLAAACLLVVLGVRALQGPGSPAPQPRVSALDVGAEIGVGVDDFELLTAPEDMALYENIEFFAWLAEQGDDSG